MNMLRAFSRVLLGLTFIFSGFTKIIDPVGVGLIIAEYMKILDLGATPEICQVVGITLSGVELMLGISLLLGIRMKVSSTIAMAFVTLFLLITLMLAIFNPIHDCGCFGEAVKLTNWESFFKNIVLFVCAYVVFRQRGKFIPIAPNHWEWLLAALYGVSVITLSVYCLRHLPLIDFTEYKSGTDLNERVKFQANTEQPIFETVVIYKKGKTIREFTVENIPDSTWTFVDSRSRQINAKVEPKSGTFTISDRSGEYITDSIISQNGALLITSIPYVERLSDSKLSNILNRNAMLSVKGIRHLILVGSSFEAVDARIKDTAGLNIFYTDLKTLITLNRSNGGMTYIFDGQVSAKWSSSDADDLDIEKILEEDPEIISANTIIREHVTVEIAVSVILLLIVIMRLVLRSAYKPNIKTDEDPSKL